MTGKTIEIEIGEKMVQANVYESMWEYIDANGATVQDYAIIPAENEGARIVRSFQPIDDGYFHAGEIVEIDGKAYQHVNWGEEEYCLIPESDIMSSFWMVYDWYEKSGGYVAANGEIFQTEEDARREVA